MTFGWYLILVGVVVLFYAFGVVIHGEVKEFFQQIDKDMKSGNTGTAINRVSLLSYPFFLSQRRAKNVYWLINGLFGVIGLLALILLFALTIPRAVASGVSLSDEIDVMTLFGPVGIIQPIIMLIAICLLFNYWLEVHQFEKWQK